MRPKTLTSNTVFVRDSAFPLAVHQQENHAASHEPHAHEFHELVILQGGAGTHVTDHGSYEICAGDVFLIRGDMAHAYADTQQVDLTNVLFKPGPLALPLHHLRDLPGYHALFRIEPKLRADSHFRQRLRLSENELTEAMDIVTALQLELATRDPGYRFAACAHLMNLLGYLARCYDHSPRPEQQSLMRLGKVLSVMERRLNEELSIKELAGIAGMSESTLTRRFKRVLGRTPIQHLLRLRINRAQRLLANREMNITQVAHACGFADSNYFSRQFREHTGQSPTTYRHALAL